jgi:spore germination protein
MHTPRNIRNVLVAMGVAAVAVPLLVSSPATAAGLPIEGYLMTGSGSQYIAPSASALSLVGIDGVNLTSTGAAVTATPPEAAGMVTAAKGHGLKTELLFGNFDESIGDFSPTIATKLLSSTANRKAVVTSLVSKVAQGGFNGVQVDLESLNSTHKAGLTKFLAELRAALPTASTISMALMATDTAAGYADEGYDMGALNGSVGRFVLMAYDQHGPTWTDAGPVGGTPWVKSVLTAFIATGVPKSKIDLGVAEYAYTWPGDGTDGVQLTVADARAKAGSRATFDATQQEWTATLADGTVIWWSDAKTLGLRKAYATQQGVHGLAVWELSLGDPIS